MSSALLEAPVLAAPAVPVAPVASSEAAAISKRQQSWGSRVGNWALTLLLVAVVALASAVVIVPRATGSVPLTVLTGSMRPTYNPGDLVIVRPVDPNTLAVGDVVTFQPRSGDPLLITHRVIGLDLAPNGQVTGLRTQGDANNAADAPIRPEQVMGRVWYSVPWLGFVTNGTNSLLLVGLAGVGLLVYAVATILSKEEPGKDEPGKDEQEANPPSGPDDGKQQR